MMSSFSRKLNLQFEAIDLKLNAHLREVKLNYKGNNVKTMGRQI